MPFSERDCQSPAPTWRAGEGKKTTSIFPFSFPFFFPPPYWHHCRDKKENPKRENSKKEKKMN
jgi:hypothetical protein